MPRGGLKYVNFNKLSEQVTRARLVRERAEFRHNLSQLTTSTPFSETKMNKGSQGRTLEEVMFGDTNLGKRKPVEDDEVEIIGFRKGKPVKTTKKKLKTKFLNDISSWTANRALIEVDKENSSGDSNQDHDHISGNRIQNFSDTLKKFQPLRPPVEKKSNKLLQKPYQPSMWS
jgi:hypothetical protein